MKLLKTTLIILLIFDIFSCHKNKKYDQDISNDKNRILEINQKNDMKTIEDYYENGIYEHYGNPWIISEFERYFGISLKEKENIEISSVFMAGKNSFISIRNFIYNDSIHYYYFWEEYVGVEINNSPRKNRTVNIGDNINRLKEIFGDSFFEYEDKIIYSGLSWEIIL